MKQRPGPAFADYLGDAIYLLKWLIISAAVTYAVVIVFQPELWRLL